MFLPQTNKTKGYKETLGSVSYVYYLDVVLVLWAFAYVQTHHLYLLNTSSSLCVNYTSMKLNVSKETFT